MYKFFIKNGQTFAFVLALVIVGLFLFTAITGVSNGGQDLEALSLEQKMNVPHFDIGIGAAIAMSALAFILAFVVFGAWGIIKNPKSIIYIVVGFAVVAALYFVGQGVISGSNPQLDKIVQEFNVSDGTSAFISGAIFTGVAMAGLSFISLVLGELKGLFS